MLSYLLCYNILAENKNKMKIDTNLKCKTGDWSCGLKLKARPTRPQLALENFLESRFQRNEVRMVKLKFWGLFIGHCMAWVARHTFSGCQVCPVHHKWLTVCVDWLIIDPKKKTQSFCPSIKDPTKGNFSNNSMTLSGKSGLDPCTTQFPHAILGRQNAESRSLSNTSPYHQDVR